MLVYDTSSDTNRTTVHATVSSRERGRVFIGVMMNTHDDTLHPCSVANGRIAFMTTD